MKIPSKIRSLRRPARVRRTFKLEYPNNFFTTRSKTIQLALVHYKIVSSSSFNIQDIFYREPFNFVSEYINKGIVFNTRYATINLLHFHFSRQKNSPDFPDNLYREPWKSRNVFFACNKESVRLRDEFRRIPIWKVLPATTRYGPITRWIAGNVHFSYTRYVCTPHAPSAIRCLSITRVDGHENIAHSGCIVYVWGIYHWVLTRFPYIMCMCYIFNIKRNCFLEMMSYFLFESRNLKSWYVEKLRYIGDKAKSFFLGSLLFLRPNCANLSH